MRAPTITQVSPLATPGRAWPAASWSSRGSERWRLGTARRHGSPGASCPELVDGLRRLGNFAALGTAASRLLADSLAVVEKVAIQKSLDHLSLVHHRIVTPNLPLHGFRRAAAVERDHRVPAALVAGGQVLDQARDLRAPFCRYVRASCQHGGE